MGNFRWRLLLIVITVILVWQSSRIWLTFAEEESVTEVQFQANQVVTSFKQDDKQKVHVTVYYEALCPDSRSFFLRQLQPTYQRISENLEIEYVPYGRATTVKTQDGYEFKCQHGPVECNANIIHACSIDVIKSPSILIDYLSCMIKNNVQPLNVMETCAEKINVDHDAILKCYSGTKGKELLAKYGVMTETYKSEISFIPAISLDGSFSNQARILKNLLQEVCLHLKILPKGCVS